MTTAGQFTHNPHNLQYTEKPAMFTDASQDLLPRQVPFIPKHSLLELKILPMQSGWLDTECSSAKRTSGFRASLWVWQEHSGQCKLQPLTWETHNKAFTVRG